MTKNRFIILMALLVITCASFGQVSVTDRRTTETKIADLLSQLPATDQTYLNSLMASMAELGEDGLVSLAGMLTPAAKGNDANVRYAVGGFSKFVSGPGQEKNRLLCQQAWCRALEASNEPEVKSFLIAQLQQVGNDLAVPCVGKYLTDPQLSDVASRALASINSPAAGNALHLAMDKAEGSPLVSIVKALGDMRYTQALADITPLASSEDADLRKVSLYALASFGSAQSEKVLLEAAKKTGFTAEATRASTSYLQWLNRIAENGNQGLAEKHAIKLIKSCTSEDQTATRGAALSILLATSGEKAAPYLFNAVKTGNREYRMTALDLSLQLKGEKYTEEWISMAEKLSGETRADVLTMLGERGDPSALPLVKESLTDGDEIIRLAAIHATAKLGGEAALPVLLGILEKASASEINAVKVHLYTYNTAVLLPAIIKAMPGLPPGSKIAMIDVLASRKNAASHDQVFLETRSADGTVRLAALQSLEKLSSSSDLGELFALLAGVKSPEEMQAVQAAVIAAVSDLPARQQVPAIIPAYDKATSTGRMAFYNIFAGIGNLTALETVINDFNEKEDPNMKNAAFEALLNWTGPNAVNELYRIAVQPENTALRAPALKSCIRLIRESGYPDDQRLLMLRKVMELAGSSHERGLVLEETGSCSTYPALKYAAAYLDETATSEAAANAVTSIVLSGTSLFGEDIREILERVMKVLTGPESEYQKEAIRKYLAAMPAGQGFAPLFNGKDLNGWKGLVENPIVRAAMKPDELAKAQAKADETMLRGWKVENGILVFTGTGENLCTIESYGDFEMFVDWKILEDGDAGIYLRGSPQVQIWDTSRRDAGAQVGSGGLYNNEVHERIPLKVADNAVGEWNTFRIIMQGERVTVYLNGELVVDNTIMENYWDRSRPIFQAEQIELQAHGTWVGYRDIYIREIPRPEPYKVSAHEKVEGYSALFDGISMFNWTGNTRDYVVEDGCIAVYPKYGGKGNLYTKAQYSDFSLRFEFQLTPGANNGIGIRTPLEGDAAYVGMEIQVLDNTAPIYRNLKDYQYHGSVYGVIPAKREFLKPLGEWNEEEIYIKGTYIRVTLNGTVIVEGDIAEASKNGTMDHNDHPGLKNTTGHIGFLGHGSVVKFRNLRIMDLTRSPQ